MTLSPKRLGWEPFVYLFYLGFLFLQPASDPDAGWFDWLFPLLLIALFLPVYFWSYRCAGRRTLPAIIGMMALGAGALLYNSGGTAFFIYAAARAAHALEPRAAWRVILVSLAVMLAAFMISAIPFPYRWWAFGPAAVFVPLIGLISILQAERERSNARLRMAQAEVERLATIAERERIARDLHDLLGHTLSSITLKSELAHKLVHHAPERAEKEMLEVERISREALSEVRLAVSGYRSKGLLAEAAAAKLICEAAGVSFAFRGDPALLSAVQESALSLILREAVTNVVRHAGARRCYAALTEGAEGVTLEVGDDGAGGRGLREGSGLTNIRERVTLLGGRLELSSAPGFHLTVRLPRAREASALAPQPLRTT